MVFYLIMKVQEEAKHLLPKKLFLRFVKLKKENKKKLFLGNLNSKRDWGHANDYCYAMWKMLQQKKPDDYVIATGKQYSIKQFINLTAKKIKYEN